VYQKWLTRVLRSNEHDLIGNSNAVLVTSENAFIRMQTDFKQEFYHKFYDEFTASEMIRNLFKDLRTFEVYSFKNILNGFALKKINSYMS
jgi:hypothetical protein